MAAPFHHLCRGFHGQLTPWPTQNRQCHERFRPHGIHITNGIGRRNSSKIEGIVDNGQKEIGTLNHGQVIRQTDHGRVIARLMTHQYPRV